VEGKGNGGGEDYGNDEVQQHVQHACGPGRRPARKQPHATKDVTRLDPSSLSSLPPLTSSRISSFKGELQSYARLVGLVVIGTVRHIDEKASRSHSVLLGAASGHVMPCRMTAASAAVRGSTATAAKACTSSQLRPLPCSSSPFFTSCQKERSTPAFDPTSRREHTEHSH